MPTYRKHSLKLVIDTSDAATPAMVYSGANECFSASFDCAIGERELCGREGTFSLTADQLQWLETYSSEVETAFDIARKDNPEYG